jgi:fructose-bisphosphate aldolase class I
MAELMFEEQLQRVSNVDGFLAALDQSGGSTPKTIRAYGISDDTYVEGETSMYDVIHAIRTRMITSPSFNGDRILGAILFENTMDREIEGIPVPTFLWKKKNVVPFLKCDKGLMELENGVQLMKPNPKGVFGTKMRSVIKEANEEGIQAIVDQQFEVGNQILAAGLVPILEPEVDINSPDKVKIEAILKEKLIEGLNAKANKGIMLKLSLPTEVNLYKDLVDHDKCVRLVALSGGYPRDEANAILAKQDGMIASFSRALAEGLFDKLTDEEFNSTIGHSITTIFEASKKK